MRELSLFEQSKVLAIIALALGAMWTSNVHACEAGLDAPTEITQRVPIG